MKKYSGVNCYEYLMLQDLQNQFLFFGGIF